jgi:hypothetical protein
MVDLLSSNRFTNIMVVVNCLMKMWHMVPMDLINAVSVAECFVKYIFKLHRLSNSIVSDCGS